MLMYGVHTKLRIMRIFLQAEIRFMMITGAPLVTNLSAWPSVGFSVMEKLWGADLSSSGSQRIFRLEQLRHWRIYVKQPLISCSLVDRSLSTSPLCWAQVWSLCRGLGPIINSRIFGSMELPGWLSSSKLRQNIVNRSVITMKLVILHVSTVYMMGARGERESLHQEKGRERVCSGSGAVRMGAAISYCSPQQVLTTAICGDDGKSPDYMHLPCPVKYEEITREAYMSLKPELFEGLRFDISRPINNKFALSNSLFMGSVDLPGNSGPVIKQSKSHFELGANLVDQKGKMDIVLTMGRVLSEARMSARVKYDVNDRFSIKADAQLTNDPHFTVGMFNFDYKGNDYQAQLTMGNNAYYGVNYMQSVTPKLSLGGEGIWLGRDRKSNMGLAARFKTDTVIATGLVKSEGQMSCTYVQKLSDKISVASDFVYNWESGKATTSIAYDYLIRQCRVRGRVDTNLCTAAYLEEKFSSGLTFLLSSELDHRRKDYKFGFGMTLGD